MTLEVIINPQQQLSTVQIPPPRSRWRRYLTLLIASFTLVGLIIVSIWFALIRLQPLISPVGEQPEVLGFVEILQSKPKVVYGFLPYWNFKYEEEFDFTSLTHLALFGLSYLADGTIQTRESNYQEPGWRNLTSLQAQRLTQKAKSQGALVTVTMTAFDNQIIESILLSSQAQDTCIEATLEFIQTAGLDGVNLDFEYVGSPSDEIRLAFTAFATKLSQRLKAANPNYHLSVSMYADSADNNRLWEMEALGQVMDHLVVMTYDFHRPASTQAGPVAPLFGANQLWTHDIVTLISKHLDKNTAEKILLGIPFYGYEWRTSTDQFQSDTYPRSGRLASYRRVQELLASDTSVAHFWNSQALSPWLTYTTDDQIYQIYYEDTRSLGFKYDLVNQTGLGGIAIWALGYEGPHPEIWQQIRQKL